MEIQATNCLPLSAFLCFSPFKHELSSEFSTISVIFGRVNEFKQYIPSVTLFSQTSQVLVVVYAVSKVRHRTAPVSLGSHRYTDVAADAVSCAGFSLQGGKTGSSVEITMFRCEEANWTSEKEQSRRHNSAPTSRPQPGNPPG